MLLGFSLNAHNAPLEVREPFAILPEELPELGAFLRPHVQETIVISTCQRFEIFVVPRAGMLEPCLAGLIAEFRHVDSGPLNSHARFYHGREAARHLFRVAAGLESKVLGEAQILGQTGRALEAARACGMIGQRLGGLVQAAISAARRAREETALGRGSVSVASQAVEQARERLGDLARRSVLLVGAGETGQLVAKSLGEVGHFIVVNRTLDRAKALAAEMRGEALLWGSLASGLADADVVICCAGARQPTISKRMVTAVQRERAYRPLLLIDLAIPRGVEHGVTRAPGVSLITLDDLQDHCSAREAERRLEVPKAEAILDHELGRAWHTWEATEAKPAVMALRQRAEEIRRVELERAHQRLRALPPEVGDTVEYLTRAIVNKLLHQPTLWMKSNPALAGATARDLFGIEALS